MPSGKDKNEIQKLNEKIKTLENQKIHFELGKTGFKIDFPDKIHLVIIFSILAIIVIILLYYYPIISCIILPQFCSEFEPYNIDAKYQPLAFGESGGAECVHMGKKGEEYKFTFFYSCGNEYGGVYWLYPPRNWGDKPGLDLRKHNKITFLVKGENGGEKITFRAGGIDNATFNDTFEENTGIITLSNEWEKREIDLSKANLSNVIGAFSWDTKNYEEYKCINFSLMNIQYE